MEQLELAKDEIGAHKVNHLTGELPGKEELDRRREAIKAKVDAAKAAEGSSAPVRSQPPQHRAGARGWTPLHAACANGNHEVVALLLAAGADFASTDADGKTASDLATEYGHTHCVELVRQRQVVCLEKACPGLGSMLRARDKPKKGKKKGKKREKEKLLQQQKLEEEQKRKREEEEEREAAEREAAAALELEKARARELHVPEPEDPEPEDDAYPDLEEAQWPGEMEAPPAPGHYLVPDD